jgi:hypothetical protein
MPHFWPNSIAPVDRVERKYRSPGGACRGGRRFAEAKMFAPPSRRCVSTATPCSFPASYNSLEGWFPGTFCQADSQARPCLCSAATVLAAALRVARATAPTSRGGDATVFRRRPAVPVGLRDAGHASEDDDSSESGRPRMNGRTTPGAPTTTGTHSAVRGLYHTCL